jgi:hypothetical protein
MDGCSGRNGGRHNRRGVYQQEMVAILSKKYNIFTTQDNEITMVNAIREMNLIGIKWPNRETPQFDLMLSEEELLVLKLKVPIIECFLD